MIKFCIGLINSIFCFITFRNSTLLDNGCGMYILALSITSILTICMLAVKCWFVILTHMNIAFIDLSTLRGGCISIEFVLKCFLYLDTWLNACVAMERTILVFKEVHFNKAQSKRVARWVILILPFIIAATLIHDPLNRHLIEYNEEKTKWTLKPERYTWCLTRFSPWVQSYNTIILFFHLLGPFTINLFSAVCIILRTARQRSIAQKRIKYQEHLREQFSQHKQLIISPLILVVLASPRLVTSLLSECFDANHYSWLFLSGYFISFIPSILVFIVFVIPSDLYWKTFQKSLVRCR